jgi:hypothetical protein
LFWQFSNTLIFKHPPPKIRDWSLDKGFLGGNGEKFKRENQKIPFKKQKLLS